MKLNVKPAIPSKLLFWLVLFLAFGCKSTLPFVDSYQSSSLTIRPVSPHTFVHISYLIIPRFGKFPCNGMIWAQGGKAIIFDTPTEDAVALELINWVETTLKAKVVGVVINHFHNDCLGGLKVFHDRGIPSYAQIQTIELAKKDSAEVPKFSFDQELILKIKNKTVINRYLGPGHTVDNVISYVPEESVLFGGCMIKEVGAGKGNLKDANLQQWPITVKKIKSEYPNLNYIIPGHGKIGGTELLDYTIELFTPKKETPHNGKGY